MIFGRLHYVPFDFTIYQVTKSFLEADIHLKENNDTLFGLFDHKTLYKTTFNTT